jgi:sialate O-acetylesterase
MRASLRFALAAIAVLLVQSSALADVKLPALFADHMVLQRDMKVPVWGWAEAGEKVTVSFGDQTKTATADKDGKWTVRLDELKAGGPYTLTVKGANTLEVKDVLVGEVWLCSGQSNMAMRVGSCVNAKDEAAAAKFPKIRMFRVASGGSATPKQDCAGSWQMCSPQTVGGFSATGYFFGRELHKELGVPIGLINSSVGGTPIEAWTHLDDQKKMLARKEVAPHAKGAITRGAGGLYNGKIAPLAPYGLRGVIWYQGERNSRFAGSYLYRFQLPTMIANWRRIWGQGDFPFLTVQLPDFKAPQTKPVEGDGWVIVREGMLKSLATPNTGLAVTLGLGNARDIHPKRKQGVGQRLALWALGTTYKKDIVYSGPLYKSSSAGGGKIVIAFDHVGGGLSSTDGKPLAGFAISGEDRKFVSASAKIVGGTVEVSSPLVKAPVAVRYAWAPNPKWNLTNKEGLPASPFRTDNWDDSKGGGK